MFGGAGDDEVEGNEGNDFVSGGDGDDVVGGVFEYGDDVLQGDAGNDAVVGGAGNDFVSGGDGDDYLNGLEDDDVLEGGSGADTFFYGAGGHDLILDFTRGEDRIQSELPFVEPQFDTDGDGRLTDSDATAEVIGDTMIIDMGLGFGQPAGENTLTVLGVTELDITVLTGGPWPVVEFA